ncbi:alpha/beta hydrolase [Flammeovirga yaeyamensis]|uniref:Alpha/beta hydrolase n=1 Tax=Flammeovirga yaeyamensis TaxID=367791 RepID=A0AAX1NC87_9BACT|nr:hypothetical protein [Flammeovirga yaeyamensis]QWG05205.1 alpha/beta hydrolase [Flammeovirga yaeyamensis]
MAKIMTDFKTYNIKTQDGVSLTLKRYCKSKKGDSVLMLHGLTSNSKTFDSGYFKNMKDYFLENAYEDVWILDWRGSSIYKDKYTNKNHNIDEVANYDIPETVEFIQSIIGVNKLHIVSICIGSMALSMSLVTNKLKNIESVTLATMGLYPKLPDNVLYKLYAIPTIAKKLLNLKKLEVVDKKISLKSGNYLLSLMAKLNNKCPNATCRNLNYLWGDGSYNTLFNHDNLTKKVHDNLQEFFGAVSLSYFQHIKLMLMNASVVSQDASINYLDLSNNFNTRVLLITGEDNHVWYDSTQEYFKILETYFTTDNFVLKTFPNYGHWDIYTGKNAYNDVFPSILKFMNTKNEDGITKVEVNEFSI